MVQVHQVPPLRERVRGDAARGRRVGSRPRPGFDSVFDTNFGADLTIVEEGNELLGRLRLAAAEGQPAALPMFTSCCPGGCIGGGGQPRFTDDQVRRTRIAALYRGPAAGSAPA